MRRAFHHHQLRPRRNQRQRSRHLLGRPKWVPRSVYKKCSRSQVTQVCGPKLLRLAWRMQRIRQEQQRIRHSGILSRRHRALPPSIRMPTRNHAWNTQPHLSNRCPNPQPVRRSLRRERRPMRASLAIRQVVAHYENSLSRERVPQRLQQWSLRIRPGPMRQHHSPLRCSRRLMPPPHESLPSPKLSAARPRYTVQSQDTAETRKAPLHTPRNRRIHPANAAAKYSGLLAQHPYA